MTTQEKIALGITEKILKLVEMEKEKEAHRIELRAENDTLEASIFRKLEIMEARKQKELSN